MRGFIPLFFGARYRQAEERQVVWVLAFTFDGLAQVGESVLGVAVLQQFDSVFKLDQRVTVFHSCTSDEFRSAGGAGRPCLLPCESAASTNRLEKCDDKNYWSGGQVGVLARIRSRAGARRLR